MYTMADFFPNVTYVLPNKAADPLMRLVYLHKRGLGSIYKWTSIFQDVPYISGQRRLHKKEGAAVRVLLPSRLRRAAFLRRGAF
jgi:hypothetical protein